MGITTAFEAALGAPQPAAVSAETVKVYVAPLVRPKILAEVSAPDT